MSWLWQLIDVTFHRCIMSFPHQGFDEEIPQQRIYRPGHHQSKGHLDYVAIVEHIVMSCLSMESDFMLSSIYWFNIGCKFGTQEELNDWEFNPDVPNMKLYRCWDSSAVINTTDQSRSVRVQREGELHASEAASLMLGPHCKPTREESYIRHQHSTPYHPCKA